MLSSRAHWLLFQRTLVWFPPTTWQFMTLWQNDFLLSVAFQHCKSEQNILWFSIAGVYKTAYHQLKLKIKRIVSTNNFCVSAYTHAHVWVLVHMWTCIWKLHNNNSVEYLTVSKLVLLDKIPQRTACPCLFCTGIICTQYHGIRYTIMRWVLEITSSLFLCKADTLWTKLSPQTLVITILMIFKK